MRNRPVRNACEDVYNFLELSAAGDKFIVWHLAKVNDESADLEPDFLVFHPDYGILVIEVKAWSCAQIDKVDPTLFHLLVGGKSVPATNPFHQAKGYYTTLRNRIQKERRLLSTFGDLAGKGKVPVTYGVAFPNIGKRRTGLKFILSPKPRAPSG